MTETCPPPLVSSARTSSNTRVTSEKYLLFQSLCKVFLQQRNLHLLVHLLLQFENRSKKRADVVVAALLASVVGSVLHKQRSLKSLLSSSLSCRPQSLPLNRLYLHVNFVVHEPPPPRPKVSTSLILLVPLPVILLPRRRPGPSGARQVWERTARVRIFILMGVPTPEPVED